MRRLHLRMYLAIVGTLLVFLVAGTVVWHHFAWSQGSVWGIESATGLAANMLRDKARTPERQQEVIDALAQSLKADVALYGADAKPIHVSERSFAVTPSQISEYGWHFAGGSPTFNWTMNDGRHLIVHPRHRFILHGLHMGLLLSTIAVILALLTYPLTRSITARLGRLQAGMLQFGGGNLAARVQVEGRDEVASLATSFNESAERIEQLVRAHQMLLANCSHELRTPLARVRLAVERVPATDPAVRAELARNIAELDALMGEMLLSSRLQASAGIDRPENVDLLALAAEEAAHFDREVDGVPASITGDPMLLRRLIRNLLDNAKAHAGGATAVRIEADGRSAQIVVEDAGAGVPEADREKIFEPFYRSRSSLSNPTQATGAGLGLSIVKQIALAHGGTVTYAPRAGGGSRFTVTLPLTD